jgi:GDP-mannose 6-dehydrogenase
MKVNVFGLGYVGCVTAACLANDGHEVAGIDVDMVKVDLINAGRSPIREPGLDEKIKTAVDSGRLAATRDHLAQADVSLVCVGTPSRENGGQDLGFLRSVSEQISEYLAGIDSYHVVNVRSTVLPGTFGEVVIPILESGSGKKSGGDFGVCMNPEFLREGTSVVDFYEPPFTVIGQIDDKSGDVVARLYSSIDAKLFRTSIKTAEMLKYVSNAFHALKVAFANEVGTFCKKIRADSREVMDLFASDRKLNISTAYLKPGFAFGGSCLPKDLRALLHKAREIDLELPLLSAVLPSNAMQIERAYELIRRTGQRRVGIIGLSFKPGTDDLRESPMVDLIEKLLGKGYTVSVFDEEVSYSRLHGSNKRYIEMAIPHISQLLCGSVEQTISGSEVIVLGSKTGKYHELLSGLGDSFHVIDLDSAGSGQRKSFANYSGISW